MLLSNVRCNHLLSHEKVGSDCHNDLKSILKEHSYLHLHDCPVNLHPSFLVYQVDLIFFQRKTKKWSSKM